MSVIPSVATGLAQLQALANFLDTGSNNATFSFYNDSKPSSVAVAANPSARLVTLSLPKPCFKALNADSIELNPTDAATVTKTGTATWARLYNGNGDGVADFAVGTDITLANPNLVLGSTLMINSIVLRPTT
ncbi:hypothetical protein MMP66_13260 [Acinetobacter dispersus]|uniref:hypothetical protein n=1 Tax=Acinetobacter dispersus TaxID=70348 RepID=UPI001F4AA151|nr:hypothetical protein [Acinetobacter dispersus]MCH7395230.1 hypothetical protein [Acinetobacter dispersus]